MPLTLLVDATTLLVAYLTAQADVTALVSGRVATRLPASPSYPCIRLTRIAGESTHPAWGDNPVFQFDCFGRTETEAWQLERVTKAALEAIPQVHALGVVTEARHIQTSWLPDDSVQGTAPQPRALLMMQFTIHP